MNLYLLENKDEKYWVSGETEEQAIETFQSCDFVAEEDKENEIIVSKKEASQWNEITITYNEDDFEETMDEYMTTCNKSEVIASTAWHE